MRILFTTLPVETHLRPLVAVAYAAQRRGHEVAVCAPATFQEEVERYGLRFLPAGHDWITGMLEPLVEARRIPPQELTLLMNRLVTQGIPGKGALAMAEEVLERSREFTPDIVVREAYELGGYLAAEVLGVPHASIGVVGRITEFLDLALLAPPLGERRQELGLPPDPDGSRVYAYLHAHFMPPHYDPAETAIPTLRCYRHHTVDLPGDRLPDLVTGLDPARPLVYASLGTVAPLFRAADGHLAMIIEGLGQLDCEAVVAVGAGKKPADLGTAVPDNVHVVDVIAQPLLLDTVDLLVTHAGFTSVREALRAGVPMVAIPWIAENHLIARTCSEQGLAVELDWETLDAAQVAHACRTVLSDPGYRARARAMQRSMLALPPLDVLVTDLEELAARGAHR
ncbi:glycosyltransferase [Thermobifida cellulosilytica]|uniref:glycosyltransferase n=1 Tax=Thermobifida cellulosilytica TaxID=144786 RepID=UPI0008381BE7|nr:glycosyltransferase [Thermobifida cellulosilytica]